MAKNNSLGKIAGNKSPLMVPAWRDRVPPGRIPFDSNYLHPDRIEGEDFRRFSTWSALRTSLLQRFTGDSEAPYETGSDPVLTNEVELVPKRKTLKLQNGMQEFIKIFNPIGTILWCRSRIFVPADHAANSVFAAGAAGDNLSYSWWRYAAQYRADETWALASGNVAANHAGLAGSWHTICSNFTHHLVANAGRGIWVDGQHIGGETSTSPTAPVGVGLIDFLLEAGSSPVYVGLLEWVPALGGGLEVTPYFGLSN